MTKSFGCKCKIKDKNNWRVVQRNYNLSYFEYPRGTRHPSEYSTVLCLKCGDCGRTKAKYVDELQDGEL